MIDKLIRAFEEEAAPLTDEAKTLVIYDLGLTAELGKNTTDLKHTKLGKLTLSAKDQLKFDGAMSRLAGNMRDGIQEIKAAQDAKLIEELLND